MKQMNHRGGKRIIQRDVVTNSDKHFIDQVSIRPTHRFKNPNSTLFYNEPDEAGLENCRKFEPGKKSGRTAGPLSYPGGSMDE